MLEHLEDGILVSLGEPEADQCFTPEENLEKWQDSLYTHRKMPKDFLAPFMNADGSLQELRHKNLDAAKQSFLDANKEEVISMLERGDTVFEICKRFNVSRNTYYMFKRNYGL